MTHRRHDLVWLSDEGKRYALRHAHGCSPRVNDDAVQALLFASPPVPAIVRRQDAAEEGLLGVGFSFPCIIDGLRLRMASAVPPDCVIKSKTPFDIANGGKKNAPNGVALEALVEAGGRYHTRVGCFGSAALQMATGLPYLNRNSDLDVYLRHEGTWEELELFFRALLEIERGAGVKIDAEIEYLGKYGVKLRELFGNGATVMGKGLYETALLPKTREGAISRRSG